jgi:hypothetical protein
VVKGVEVVGNLSSKNTYLVHPFVKYTNVSCFQILNDFFVKEIYALCLVINLQETKYN